VLAPKDEHTWFNKGVALMNLNRPQDALRCFDISVGLNDRYVKGHNNRGSALAHLGKHEMAVEAYEKALKWDSKNAVAWHNKGRALEFLGKLDEALHSYDKSLEYNPKDIDAQRDRRICADKLDKRIRGEEAAREKREMEEDTRILQEAAQRIRPADYL
jgi:tetratricopeptide (TPR) repeat protein